MKTEQLLKNIGFLTQADLDEHLPIFTDTDIENLNSKLTETAKNEAILKAKKSIGAIFTLADDFKQKNINDLNDIFFLDIYHKCRNFYNDYKTLSVKIREEVFIGFLFKKSLKLLLNSIRKQEVEKEGDFRSKWLKLYEITKNSEQLIDIAVKDFENGNKFAVEIYEWIFRILTSDFRNSCNNKITQLKKTYLNSEAMNIVLKQLIWIILKFGNILQISTITLKNFSTKWLRK